MVRVKTGKVRQRRGEEREEDDREEGDNRVRFGFYFFK